MSDVDALVRTLLYEGYVLWPYRRSALKNRQRWTFGGVYPRAYSDAAAGVDRWTVHAEVPVVGHAPRVDVAIRFLHVVDRRVAVTGADGTERLVDEASVDGRRVLAWEEATERSVALPTIDASLRAPLTVRLDITAGEEREELGATDAGEAAAIIRTWAALRGEAVVRVERVAETVARISIDVANRSLDPTTEREVAVRQAFVAANLVLRVRDGAFVSLLEPAAGLSAAAAACRNEGLFPVLLGPDGATDSALASPIILYDHPRIAPESPGDLFDATEIDQMLVLNVLALTDDEKAEVRATDPRTATLLDRTEALDDATLRSLNGAIRDFRRLGPDGRWDAPTPDFFDLDPSLVLHELDRPGPTSLETAAGVLGPGARVLLRPHPGRDAFDLVLAGRVGIVESIETDFEGASQVAVTLEDDPGRGLGVARLPGHRFFMSPDEVELVVQPVEAVP